MNRRGFFGALAAAFIADPEKALWVPGRKLISIPRPVTDTFPIPEDIFTLGWEDAWIAVTRQLNTEYRKIATEMRSDLSFRKGQTWREILAAK